MGDIEDGQDWKIDPGKLLLAIEDRHTDRVGYGMRRRDERKICLSLLKALFELTCLGK